MERAREHTSNYLKRSAARRIDSIADAYLITSQSKCCVLLSVWQHTHTHTQHKEKKPAFIHKCTHEKKNWSWSVSSILYTVDNYREISVLFFFFQCSLRCVVSLLGSPDDRRARLRSIYVAEYFLPERQERVSAREFLCCVCVLRSLHICLDLIGWWRVWIASCVSPDEIPYTYVFFFGRLRRWCTNFQMAYISQGKRHNRIIYVKI